MPTVSADMLKHYVYPTNDGEFFDLADAIDTWEMMSASCSDIGNMLRAQGEDELREAADKAEYQLKKKGPVGDYCRAWSITELITGQDDTPGPLADVYEIVEYANGAAFRLT